MDTAKFLTPVIRFLRNQHSISKAGKIGGKYLSRKQVPDPKTGRMKWEYTYASKKDGNQVKSQEKPAENKNMKNEQEGSMNHVTEYRKQLEMVIGNATENLKVHKEKLQNYEQKQKERPIYSDEIKEQKSYIKDKNETIRNYTKILKDPKLLQQAADEWNEGNTREQKRKEEEAKTPLVSALRNRDISSFNKNLKSGKANVNEQNSNGDTAAHLAVALNEPALLQKLVDAGADLHSIKNSQGQAVGNMIQQSRNPKMVDIYRKYMDKQKEAFSS